MHAIRAVYRNGNIEPLSPLPAPDGTELLVIVPGRSGLTGTPCGTLENPPNTSAEAFQALGTAVFSYDDDDQDVDWEDAFDVRAR